MRSSLLKLAVITLAISRAFALHPLQVDKGRLVDGVTKQPIGLFGVNLFESHLGWAVEQDIGEMERNLAAIAKFGFNALRVPLNMSYIEPAPDVFPDSPEYSQIMRRHNLKDGFPSFLDALVRKAEELGLYVIPEFHELPADPWRYFAGGNEQLRGTGKHGGAISWLADITEKEGNIEKVELNWDKAYEYVPKALAWLARHYKGNPTLAAIEVPWNEPVGGWADDEKLYYRLVEACARAIKKEDPNRLVFMDVQDWGAGVNFLPSSSTWHIPPEVDALFPHFYFGTHCPNTPYERALRCAVANWTSWFTGWGKPVLVGEYDDRYGVTEDWCKKHQEELEKLYALGNGELDLTSLYADVIKACLKQWEIMGVQGAFYWAWWKGIPGGPDGDLSIARGFDILRDYAISFKKPKFLAVNAPIAVVCDISRRSQYGSPQDLFLITEALIAKDARPFHTIFAQALMDNKALLRKGKYSKVILLADGLSEEAMRFVREIIPEERLFVVHQEEPDWQAKLEIFLQTKR